MKKHVKAIATTASILFVILVAALVWKSQNAPATNVTPEIDPIALKYANQANDYNIQGKHSQAVEDYKKSLQIQPDPDVQIQLGVTLVRAGRREEAIKTLREVAQKSGRAGDAAKSILNSVERNPNWGTEKE